MFCCFTPLASPISMWIIYKQYTVVYHLAYHFLFSLQSITRETTAQTPKKKKGLTPKKLGKKGGLHLQSPGGPTAVRSTNFVEVASMTVTADSINKTHFNLERVSDVSSCISS